MKNNEEIEVRERYRRSRKWMKAPNGKPTNLNERQWVHVRTPSFKRFFGDWENDRVSSSKVIDDNGEPMVVYSGHSQAVLWGDRYNPKRSIAGAFYSSESPETASGYALGKFGDYQYFENMSQYRFRAKNGKFTRTISSIVLNSEQIKLFDELVAKGGDEDNDDGLACAVHSAIDYSKTHAGNDSCARNLSWNPHNLYHLYAVMESLGHNITYNKYSNAKEGIPHALLQDTSYFEDLLSYLGIEWESYLYDKPAVFPLFLDVRTPLDASRDFPLDLLTALDKVSRRSREQPYQRDEHWRKTYSMKDWVESIKDNYEFWSTQIPEKALPVIRRFRYDGIMEHGNKACSERGSINWMSFDAIQIKSAIANNGNYSRCHESILL